MRSAIYELAKQAKPEHEADWGSESQIKRENLFWEAVTEAGVDPEEIDPRATLEEALGIALELLGEKRAS